MFGRKFFTFLFSVIWLCFPLERSVAIESEAVRTPASEAKKCIKIIEHCFSNNQLSLPEVRSWLVDSSRSAVLEVLGVKNVLAKTIGSSKPINVIKATLKGLSQMTSPEMVAEKRGKSVGEIYG